MFSVFSRFRRRTVAAACTAAGAAALVAGGLAAAPPAVAAYPSGAATAATVPCNVVPVFETDGFTNGPYLRSFDATFNQHVPAGYAPVRVPYADGVIGVPGIQNNLDQGVADGQRELSAAVHAYHDKCPGSRIIISGYSEGAVVAGNEISALSRSSYIRHDLIQGALYGDPRRPFGYGGVGGTAGGIETNLPTLLPGVTMQGPNTFGDIAVHEVCNQNDGICNSTNLITNAAAFANGIAGYLPQFGAHGYDLDPVKAVAGPLLDFRTQAPIVPYGPPLPVPGLGTPWQIQQVLGQAAGVASYRSAFASVRPLLPQSVLDALAADPLGRLLES